MYNKKSIGSKLVFKAQIKFALAIVMPEKIASNIYNILKYF